MKTEMVESALRHCGTGSKPVGIADVNHWIDGDGIGMDDSIAGGNSTMRRLEAEDRNVVVLVNLGPDEGGSAASAMRRSGWCLDRRSVVQRPVASSNSPIWSAEPSLSRRKNRQFLRMSDRAAYPMIVPEAVTSLRAAEGGECFID